MSGQTVTLEHSEKWNYFWKWGNETFYDDNRGMITFSTPAIARQWLTDNHPDLYEIKPPAKGWFIKDDQEGLF